MLVSPLQVNSPKDHLVTDSVIDPVDCINAAESGPTKRLRQKGSKPVEELSLKKTFQAAKKTRLCNYSLKLWSLVSGDRPQNLRLFLWLSTLMASLGVALYQTWQYIDKYESAPISTLVTPADVEVIPLPAVLIEEPYYPFKTNESSANSLVLRRDRLFIPRYDITGEPTHIGNTVRIKTLMSGSGPRGLGILTMDPNQTGVNPWRELYGSLSFIHDLIVERCDNSNVIVCKFQPSDWKWDSDEELFVAKVPGGEWRILWSFVRKNVYSRVAIDDVDLMVPRPVLVFYPNMTFTIGKYYQQQPYLILQLYSHLPPKVHFDDLKANPGWHVSLVDSREQRMCAFSAVYRENIVVQEWKVYPIMVKIRKKFKLSKKQRPCTGYEDSSSAKCCDDFRMKWLEKHPAFRCRPPWLSQKRFFRVKMRQCQDQAEMEEAMRVHKMVAAIDCPCPERCRTNEYFPSVSGKILDMPETETDAVRRQLSVSRVEFRFSMNIEKLEEVWSYDFTGFVGEIGGTLGMLLGVSVLSIFELIQTMLCNNEEDEEEI